MFKVPTTDNFGNSWRNAALVLLVVVFVFMGGTHIVPRFFQTSFSAKILSSLEAVGNLSAATPDQAPAPASVPNIPAPKLPERVGDAPAPESFTASSIVVKDSATGALLYGKNEYEPRPIASITKLMSALVLLERHPAWVSSTQVVADDVIDTHMYAGDTYTIKQLWNMMLIASSNKAVLTLVDASGLPREAFVARMNEKATELGMTGTTFVEPTGLDEGNIATASDLAILLSVALETPDIKKIVLEKEYTIFSKERKKSHHVWNTNWLLLGWIPNKFTEIRGGKTGFITLSGYNFVTQVVDENKHVLDVVVLGAASHEQRFTEARDIAEWAYENYKWPQ